MLHGTSRSLRMQGLRKIPRSYHASSSRAVRQYSALWKHSSQSGNPSLQMRQHDRTQHSASLTMTGDTRITSHS